jgi:hypothetical protein
MKTQRMFTALLFGTLALAAMAPIASAKSHDRDDSRGRGHESRGRGDSDDRGWRSRDDSDDRGWRDSRDDGWRTYDRRYYGGDYDRDDRYRRGTWVAERSYFYLDPITGRRSSYISDFKDCYDNYDNPAVILMIDIRTGRQLGAFRYDDRVDHWRPWYGRAYGRSWSDRPGYRVEIRGTGVYGGYPSR